MGAWNAAHDTACVSKFVADACHAERSEMVRRANHLTQSKHPYGHCWCKGSQILRVCGDASSCPRRSDPDRRRGLSTALSLASRATTSLRTTRECKADELTLFPRLHRRRHHWPSHRHK